MAPLLTFDQNQMRCDTSGGATKVDRDNVFGPVYSMSSGTVSSMLSNHSQNFRMRKFERCG